MQTVGPIDGMYYTLYPERVTYDVAKAACAKTGGAALAMLKNREVLDKVGKELLRYAPDQVTCWCIVQKLSEPVLSKHAEPSLGYLEQSPMELMMLLVCLQSTTAWK